MTNYKIRQATIEDIDFLVEAIIAAEKGYSDKLSYTSIFGLSVSETSQYLRSMLEEEIDGCELSISSYLVVEKNSTLVAAMGCWIEGIEDGISSATIKGNLLSFTLPLEVLKNAKNINNIVSGLSIDYIFGTLCVGIVYVNKEHRGQNLVKLLLERQLDKYVVPEKNLEICIQVFGNNIPALKAYERLGFLKFKTVKSNHIEIKNYLPSNKKILLTKTINYNGKN